MEYLFILVKTTICTSTAVMSHKRVYTLGPYTKSNSKTSSTTKLLSKRFKRNPKNPPNPEVTLAHALLKNNSTFMAGPTRMSYLMICGAIILNNNHGKRSLERQKMMSGPISARG